MNRQEESKELLREYAIFKKKESECKRKKDTYHEKLYGIKVSRIKAALDKLDISTIEWYTVEQLTPPFGKEVIVICKNGKERIDCTMNVESRGIEFAGVAYGNQLKPVKWRFKDES
ncbi:MAG: hypothetical protein GY782_01000 [Gammaproteobacteria bacterium]|nr:hypothetical protein [Gammaproteobacteria bacterium]